MANISGINSLLKEDLTEALKTMVDYADLVDINYYGKPSNPIMRYWQNKNVSFKSILYVDLLDWLCCLAFSDGFIADEEVHFINAYLDNQLSKDDIIDLCKVKINESYFNTLPLSFILIYEDDLAMKSCGSDKDYNNLDKLYKLFLIMGIQFIFCDNNFDTNELETFKRYTEDLFTRISSFDLAKEQEIISKRLNEEIKYDNYVDETSFCETTFDDYFEDLNESEDEINAMKDEYSVNVVSSSDFDTNELWDFDKDLNEYYSFTGEFDNHLVSYNDIFTQNNRRILENTRLTPQQYRCILNKIKSTSDSILYKNFNEKYIDFNSLDTFEKMLVFTKSFTNVNYKETGEELGNYSLNYVNVDKRWDMAQKTTTLIHELAHHLIAEIFEQAVMVLFNTDKSDSIEVYVDTSFKSSNQYVIFNEFCAHRVESHFTPPKYQHYGSFVRNLEEFDLTNIQEEQNIVWAMLMGNTISYDILTIIEPFIDSINLKDEILSEFENDIYLPDDFYPLSFDNDEIAPIYYLLEFINEVLLAGFEEFSNL